MADKDDATLDTDNDTSPEAGAAAGDQPQDPAQDPADNGLFDAQGRPIHPDQEGDIGSDHTVILSMAHKAADATLDDFTLEALTINPVVEHASKLLATAMQLRNDPESIDIDVLHLSMIDEIKAFENRMLNEPFNRVSILAIRYCMCTFIDEFVLRSQIGSASNWSNRSLLNTFYNETWGGEKFFQVLERLSYEPQQNLHLLELLYICIRLGFQGRYRVADNGRDELAGLSDDLFNTIRRERGDFERELSPAWESNIEANNKLRRMVPIWLLLLLIVACLVGGYMYFSTTLESDVKDDVSEIDDRINNILGIEGIANVQDATQNSTLEPQPDTIAPIDSDTDSATQP